MPPIISPAETQTRSMFLALMWSLSRPGMPGEMPAASPYGAYAEDGELSHFISVGRALLDLETSFYTPHPGLAQALAHTGARATPPAKAAYLFFPRLRELDLPDVEQAATGDYLYPDRAATLIIGCKLQAPDALQLRLSGPGVHRQMDVRVGGLLPAFWPLRERRLRYPLGWDAFLLSQNHVIGLPRTTRVDLEVL